MTIKSEAVNHNAILVLEYSSQQCKRVHVVKTESTKTVYCKNIKIVFGGGGEERVIFATISFKNSKSSSYWLIQNVALGSICSNLCLIQELRLLMLPLSGMLLLNIMSGCLINYM